jgi:NTP pyrophosphatase (non-canonical NTP hydrolase)
MRIRQDLGLINDGLEAYQQAARRTSRSDQELDMRLMVAALGLVGEAGEVADQIKKIVGHGHPVNPAHLIEELGDVLWYLAEIAGLFGGSLGSAAVVNVRKLEARYPEGFSEEASRER